MYHNMQLHTTTSDDMQHALYHVTTYNDMLTSLYHIAVIALVVSAIGFVVGYIGCGLTASIIARFRRPR